MAVKIIIAETENFKENSKKLKSSDLKKTRNDIKINPGIGSCINGDELDYALFLHQSSEVAIYYLLKIESGISEDSIESIETIKIILVSASPHKEMIDSELLSAIKFLLRLLRVI